MSTDLFCEIVAGERPAYVVSSDEVAVSFLDTRPVFKGHVLVVPRVHVETLTDLADVGPFFERVQAMARAVEEGLEAAGTFVAMNNRVSQSVAHLHVHVVPRNKKDGLRGFFWPRTKYDSAEEAESYADRIAKAL
ncbi:histidine triad (HIT) family protein [Nonomuraea solani]|uniref:Histidine triad (HIT) family protein n=1 Tax=Nonomuraea solani TaxID=1144553 RepID=A0A1H5YND4_9ACTN|nr:HIT family protein [Nonomuraea solani]SEG25661.1 histidine triad (HIT) family protein [Nonomuraea solani]